MNQHKQEQPGAVVATSAGEVAQEFGFNVEQLASLAYKRPRDEQAALAAIVRELESFPELAEQHFYSIPYKSRGETVFVEGLSVKAAKNIGRRWGNCVFEGSIVEEGEDRVVCRGICLDLETLYIASVQKVASRVMRKRDGSTYKLNEDKWTQKIDATVSKCVRNAILDTLSVAVRDRIFQTARRVAAGDAENLAKNVEHTLQLCESKGIARADVERVVGKPGAEWTRDDYGHMVGVLNAIADGQTTRAEVFGQAYGGGTPEERATNAAAGMGPETEVTGPGGGSGEAGGETGEQQPTA